MQTFGYGNTTGVIPECVLWGYLEVRKSRSGFALVVGADLVSSITAATVTE